MWKRRRKWTVKETKMKNEGNSPEWGWFWSEWRGLKWTHGASLLALGLSLSFLMEGNTSQSLSLTWSTIKASAEEKMGIHAKKFGFQLHWAIFACSLQVLGIRSIDLRCPTHTIHGWPNSWWFLSLICLVYPNMYKLCMHFTLDLYSQSSKKFKVLL